MCQCVIETTQIANNREPINYATFTQWYNGKRKNCVKIRINFYLKIHIHKYTHRNNEMISEK